MNPIYLSLEKEIRELRFGDHPKSLYEPLRYIMRIGGKRLRPVLTLLAYSLYKDDVKPVVPVAAAVETFHNFTLLHDDIMDNAPLRRGKQTVHKKWSVNTAILAGDVMQIKVYDMLLTVPDALIKEVLLAFNRCATSVCEGQQLDMEFESRPKVTEAQYLEMIRLKTAELLGFSLELGAILGGAPPEDRKALYDFGIHIGVGFQLKDDLLDVYANRKKFGKLVGGDIIANKKTFLLIKSLEKARGKVKQEMLHWLKVKKFNNTKKVKSVTAIYDELGIQELTLQKINSCFDLGLKSLERVSSGPEKTATLREFALQLMARQV